MSRSNQVRKAAVRCENCSTIRVAEIQEDGSIRPIGIEQDCTCGEGSFQQIT